MKPYRHTVQYYETDKMAIVHHSNYVRWMEEARVDYLRQAGWPLEKLEEENVVSPVVRVECSYRHVTRFGETVDITAWVEKVNPVKFSLCYSMVSSSGNLVCEGRTEHCFTDVQGRIVRLSRTLPGFYEALCREAEAHAVGEAAEKC